MGRLALGGRPGESPVQRPQRYVTPVGQISYPSAGQGTVSLNLPQTDYLTGIDLIGHVTVTTGATAPTGLSGAGAYAPYANIAVHVNGGRTPFNLPGWHANVYYQIHDHDYIDALASTPLSTSTTNNWVNPLRIPLTFSPRNELGCWFTGDTTLNLSLAITWNPIASVFGTVNSATLGGYTQVYREYFTAPNPDQPYGWLNQISYYRDLEVYTTQQLSNGITNILLPIDQDYVRIILIFYTGSVSSANFAPADGLYTNLSLIVNTKFRLWESVEEQEIRFQQLRDYKRLLPAGTAVLDFSRLDPMVRRDILPTDPTSAKELKLSIASTSSSNFVDVILETSVDSQFAIKWIQAAAQNQAAAAKAAGS